MQKLIWGNGIISAVADVEDLQQTKTSEFCELQWSRHIRDRAGIKIKPAEGDINRYNDFDRVNRVRDAVTKYRTALAAGKKKCAEEYRIIVFKRLLSLACIERFMHAKLERDLAVAKWKCSEGKITAAARKKCNRAANDALLNNFRKIMGWY